MRKELIHIYKMTHLDLRLSSPPYSIVRKCLFWHKVMSCHLGAFTSKCVPALSLLHQVHMKMILCLYFMTYFPMVVKNDAIVSFVNILR